MDVVSRRAESLAVCILLSSPVLTKLFLMFFTGLAKLFPHSLCCLLMIITLLTEEMYQLVFSLSESQIITLNPARMVLSALQYALWDRDTAS